MGSRMRRGAGSLLTVAAPVIILSSCVQFCNLVIIPIYLEESFYLLNQFSQFSVAVSIWFLASVRNCLNLLS